MIVREFFDLLSEEKNGGEISKLKFFVVIGENEGENIPHFHLFNNENGSKRKSTAIRLDMSYYFLHGDKNYILNSKEKKNLISWLKSKPKIKPTLNNNGEYPDNNWENLKNIWNGYYPKTVINCNMPNYELLEKDYKEFLDQK